MVKLNFMIWRNQLNLKSVIFFAYNGLEIEPLYHMDIHTFLRKGVRHWTY